MRPNPEPSSSGPDQPAPAGVERPPLDLARVPTPARVIVGAGLVYLLVLLLPWNRFCLPRGCLVATGVAGVGVLCFLLVVGLLVWELAPLLGRRWGLGPSELYVTFGLTGALFLFTVIRVAVRPDRLPRSLFAWIGLILSVGMGVGAYLRVMRPSAAAPDEGLVGAHPPAPEPADPEAPTAPIEPPADRSASGETPLTIEAGAVATAPAVVEPASIAPGDTPVGPEQDDPLLGGAAAAGVPGATGPLAVEPTTELPTPPEPGAEPYEPPPTLIEVAGPDPPEPAEGAEPPDGEAPQRRKPAARRSRASRTPPTPS